MDVLEEFKSKDELDENLPLQVLNTNKSKENETQKNRKLEVIDKECKNGESITLLSDASDENVGGSLSVLSNENENESGAPNDQEIEGLLLADKSKVP